MDLPVGTAPSPDSLQKQCAIEPALSLSNAGTSLATRLPEFLVEETALIAGALRSPESLPELRDILGEGDTKFQAREAGAVWRALNVLNEEGKPTTAVATWAYLESAGDEQALLVLSEALEKAATYTGPAPGNAAVRRAKSIAEKFEAERISRTTIEIERKTPLRFAVLTRRDGQTLHLDTVQLGEEAKREAIAASIVSVSGMKREDVLARLIDGMQAANEAAELEDKLRGVPQEKQAELLLGLCRDVAFAHDADNTAYATWLHEGARQTWRVRTTSFKTWLAWKAYSELELVPSNNAMQEALTTLEGLAIHRGNLIAVHRRVAELDDKLYLDLCNAKWQAVEIRADGWRVVSDPPVRFTRGTGMLPLPEPVTSGALGMLRRYLNCADASDFDVCVAWLIGAYQPKGPYPILALSGRQGSAKSTAARLLIALVDPNKAPLRSKPKSEDDMMVAAQHSRAICFDNVSGLSADLSDALCRIATGGGAAKRKLYTDDEAVILDVCAPLILTGIGNYINRGDLADRALPVGLKPLRDEDYITERELWDAFNADRAGILGGIMDALVCSLKNRDKVRGSSRMADFERVVEAAGPALCWQAGYFNRLLARVRDKNRRDSLNDDELAQAIVALAGNPEGWEGTMQQLRELLAKDADNRLWLPKTARGLASAVKRLEPLLESVSVAITNPAKRTTRFKLVARDNAPDVPDVPNPVSGRASEPGALKGGREDDSATAHQPPGNVSAKMALNLGSGGGLAHRAHSNRDDTFNEKDLDRMADETPQLNGTQ
jgi:hypothetical protein